MKQGYVLLGLIILLGGYLLAAWFGGAAGPSIFLGGALGGYFLAATRG